jgi:long-subunit fatty acid transport protein
LTPIVGFASANYYSDETLNNSSISAVDFGVNGDYYFNDRWSLRSGLLFQTMGSKYGPFEEKLKYVTIPVNANWHFGSTRKWNLNFGPSVGFLMSADVNGQDVKEMVNSTQIGFSYGIGYKIEVSEKFSILVDFQGLTGLTEVVKDSNFTIKNYYGAFNVGGVFKL